MALHDTIINHKKNYGFPVKYFKRKLEGGLAKSFSAKAGQSLVELALVAPITVSVVLMLIMAGQALLYKQNLEAVARETTRVIVKNTGNSSVQIGIERAQEVAVEYKLDKTRLAITVSGVSDTYTPPRGGRVTASVSYPFRFLFFEGLLIKADHSEIIECWRARDDENSGGTCLTEDD